MTDLEMTKLCAEAMGLKFRVRENGIGNDDVSLDGVDLYDDGSNMWNRCYSPLHDDAQAMALVKRFRLSPCAPDEEGGTWEVVLCDDVNIRGFNADLNRAIMECVAKMQAA